MDVVWKDLVVHKFNNEDVIAREAMEHFYADEDGWNQEQLYRPDMVIAEWRRLASKHNRGIQRRPAARGQDLTPDAWSTSCQEQRHDGKLEKRRAGPRPADPRARRFRRPSALGPPSCASHRRRGPLLHRLKAAGRAAGDRRIHHELRHLGLGHPAPHARGAGCGARGAEFRWSTQRATSSARSQCGGSVKNEDPAADAAGAQTPIADEIAPRDGEFVISKTKASAFFQTPLAIYLVRHQVDSLIVMGTATSGCVRASAVDGFSHGYPTFVVSDGCFDRSQFFHDVTLYDLSTKYATIVTVADTIEYLKSFVLKAAE